MSCEAEVENGPRNESSEGGGELSCSVHTDESNAQKPVNQIQNPMRLRQKPTKTLDLGIFGKIPLHALSSFWIETHDKELLTLYQTKTARTLGSWVYDGASCLAKYLEKYVLPSEGSPYPKEGCMRGQTLVELGAGTGVVGVLAAYHGADAIITDLENLVPLINYNIAANAEFYRGTAVGAALCWGDDAACCMVNSRTPDWLILANCVYYDASFLPLHQTMLDLTTTETRILVCYEERSPGIALLIQRWHDEISDDFTITPIPQDQFIEGYPDFVRLCWMKRKRNSLKKEADV